MFTHYLPRIHRNLEMRRSNPLVCTSYLVRVWDLDIGGSLQTVAHRVLQT
jgi:hypothetical protein